MSKRVLALLSFFAVFGAGCVSQTTTAPQPTPILQPEFPAGQAATSTENVASKTWDVSIADFLFQEATLTVKKGDRISFTNKDAVDHSATADGGAFDTGLIAPDVSAVIDTSNLAPGAYGYHCVIHPNMKGTIVVE